MTLEKIQWGTIQSALINNLAKPSNTQTIFVKTLIDWDHLEVIISVHNKRREFQI